MMTVELKGVEELKAKFKKLGAAGEKAINDAINLTAVEANSYMQTQTPVQTNRLRSSMHVETNKTTQNAYSDKLGHSYDGKFSIQLDKLQVAFGSNVSYATSANEKSSSPRFLEKGASYAKDRLNVNAIKFFNKAIDEAKR